ncbi:molybdopterin synthase [Halovivax limisalsi]|uniref:molybdopterin synthase n=1 Tax=Halovivax limisalsi TaxID=1453760 RepID=UPI001FFCF5F8|nr:molybdopterin synthase [Halovivax limisalsi]
MHVLGITDDGASAGAISGAVDRLVGRFGREGRVGVIRYDATIADGATSAPDRAPSGGDVTYDLGADGDWAATGTGLSVAGALDSLATECDFAVVVGVENLAHPTIAVGADPEAAGDHLVAVDSPGDLDVDAIFRSVAASDPHETLESLVRRVERSPRAERAGAIATFTGRVRARDEPDDSPTEYLEFEAYEDVAAERMRAIEDALLAREGVHEVALHHRTGVVRSGEDVVYAVVLAGHRAEAFRAVEDGIDRLKDEVPLFKKEVTVDDEFWAHERE